MDVAEPARTILAECFRKFGIETLTVEDRFAQRMETEKVDGCVIRLGEQAESIMQAARNSAANNRIDASRLAMPLGRQKSHIRWVHSRAST